MSWMGIDIGTSGCKAVAFDSGGSVLAEAHRSYATLTPREGWAELDSGAVVEACYEVLAEAGQTCHAHDPVQGLGISSQGEAFTAVGPDGEFLTNAMVSFDTRATEVGARWSEEFGTRRLYEITGHTCHPMFTLPKLLWTRDNLPDVWERAAAFHCFEELLHRRLGLRPAISHPLAGRTMLFDVRRHEWSPEILAAMQLSPDRLARTLPAGAVVGQLSPAVARDLGFATGAIVVAGGHDQPCGALGAGVTAPGRAMYGMGTVECICPAFAEPTFSEELFAGNLCTYDFTIAGMYTTVAFSLTGGNLLRWYHDVWAGDERRVAVETGGNAYDLIANSLPEGPSGLTVLPHFTPTGTPHFDPTPTSAVLGMTLETTRGQFLKGLLEGVSLEMKLNVAMLDESGVRIDEFVATGGSARRAELVQIRADVLNRPITSVAVTEAGCLGVAMLACSAATEADLPSISSEWVRPVHVIEPRPDVAARYEDQFSLYRELYPALRRLRG
jgi:xylulokinase